MDFVVQDVIYYDRKRFKKYLSFYCILHTYNILLQQMFLLTFRTTLKDCTIRWKIQVEGKGRGY